MDPKVWGKLLTLHRRGYDDVEAPRDDGPLPAELRNRPQDGISWIQKVAAVELGFWLRIWLFGGMYVYIGGRSMSVELWGAHEAGGRAPTLVTASFVPWRRVQVSWITFGEKITFPKVSFCLDSIWYSVSLKHWNRQKKQQFWAGPPINRLVPKII